MTVTPAPLVALTVTAPRGVWLDALNACALGISRQAESRILTITREEHGTVLSSYNGSFCVHYQLDDQAGEPLSWGLNHKELIAAVRTAAPDRRTVSDALPVELQAQGNTVQVVCQGALVAQLPMLSGPTPRPDEADELVEVSTKQLKKLASGVLYAASELGCRGLEQVRVAAEQDWLELVATDGRRIAAGSVQLAEAATFAAFPGGRQLARVLRLLKDRTTSLGAAPWGGLTVTNGPLRVTIPRHTDTEFPKHEWISHFTADTWVDLDRAEFLAAVTWCRDLGVENTLVIELHDGATTARLHAGHVEERPPARDISQPASHALDQFSGYRDGKILLAFNPCYIAEILDHSSASTVRLTLTRSHGPVMFSDARHDVTDPHTLRAVTMSQRDAY